VSRRRLYTTLSATAYHEAGHAVAAVLLRRGAVSGTDGGGRHSTSRLTQRSTIER
jgi:hypothetical protein